MGGKKWVMGGDRWQGFEESRKKKKNLGPTFKEGTVV